MRSDVGLKQVEFIWSDINCLFHDHWAQPLLPAWKPRERKRAPHL